MSEHRSRTLTKTRPTTFGTTNSSHRIWAFGSCTPRYFDYLDNIPQSLRLYNVKLPCRHHDAHSRSLVDYMREARETPRAPGRDQSLDSSLARRVYAFGSSTPREFSHLDKLDHEWRIYDVRLKPINGDRRSRTTHSFTNTQRRSKTTDPGLPPPKYERRASSLSRTPGAGAASSRASSKTGTSSQHKPSSSGTPTKTTKTTRKRDTSTNRTTVKKSVRKDESKSPVKHGGNGELELLSETGLIDSGVVMDSSIIQHQTQELGHEPLHDVEPKPDAVPIEEEIMHVKVAHTEAAVPEPEPALESSEPEPALESSEPEPLLESSEPEPAPDASEPELVPDASETEPVPDASVPEPAPEVSEPDPAPKASEPELAPDASEPESAPNASEPEPAPAASGPESEPETAPDATEPEPEPAPDASEPEPEPETVLDENEPEPAHDVSEPEVEADTLVKQEDTVDERAVVVEVESEVKVEITHHEDEPSPDVEADIDNNDPISQVETAPGEVEAVNGEQPEADCVMEQTSGTASEPDVNEQQPDVQVVELVDSLDHQADPSTELSTPADELTEAADHVTGVAASDHEPEAAAIDYHQEKQGEANVQEETDEQEEAEKEPSFYEKIADKVDDVVDAVEDKVGEVVDDVKDLVAGEEDDDKKSDDGQDKEHGKVDEEPAKSEEESEPVTQIEQHHEASSYDPQPVVEEVIEEKVNLSLKSEQRSDEASLHEGGDDDSHSQTSATGSMIEHSDTTSAVVDVTAPDTHDAEQVQSPVDQMHHDTHNLVNALEEVLGDEDQVEQVEAHHLDAAPGHVEEDVMVKVVNQPDYVPCDDSQHGHDAQSVVTDQDSDRLSQNYSPVQSGDEAAGMHEEEDEINGLQVQHEPKIANCEMAQEMSVNGVEHVVVSEQVADTEQASQMQEVVHEAEPHHGHSSPRDADSPDSQQTMQRHQVLDESKV